MDIEIKEQGSDAFYREVVNVSYHAAVLSKKPDVKIRNMYTQYTIYMLVEGMLAGFCVFRGLNSYFDISTILILVMVASTVATTLMNYHKMNTMMMRAKVDFSESVLTINERGVSLTKQGRHIVHIAWNEMAGIRILKESICFIGKNRPDRLICVQMRYKDQVMQALDIYNKE